jgi:hypothetical protein
MKTNRCSSSLWLIIEGKKGQKVDELIRVFRKVGVFKWCPLSECYGQRDAIRN